jgi:hypothetical protein
MKPAPLEMKAINRGLFESSRSLVRIRLLSLCLLAALGSSWSIAFGQQPASAAAPLFNANARYVQGVGPGYWPTAGSGLTLNLAAGTAFCNASPVTYAGGTLTLAPNATNYVYLNPAAACAPASNTSGFSPGHIPLAKTVTGASSITSVTDVRGWFVPQPVVTDSSGGAIASLKKLNSVRFADQFAIGSSTAGIQEAINDFGDADTMKCGIVILPYGQVSISATIDLAQRQGCELAGHGAADQFSNTELDWRGPAGVPMIKLSGMGNYLHDFHLVGNAGAKPSAGIELAPTSAYPYNGNGSRNVVERVMIGLYNQPSYQLTRGLLFSSTANGDTNAFPMVSIWGVDYGVDIENGNASDLHFDTLDIGYSGTAFKCRSSAVEGTNWLFVGNGLDFELASSQGHPHPKVEVHGFVSEWAGQFIQMGLANLTIENGNFEFTSSLTTPNFIDMSSYSYDGQFLWLKNFNFFPVDYTGTPVIQECPSAASVAGYTLKLDNVIGLNGSQIICTQDPGHGWPGNTNVAEFEQEPGYGFQGLHARNYLGWGGAWDPWLYEFLHKVTVTGGPLTLAALAKPDQYPVTCTPTGSGATTYAYRVTSVSGTGETLPAAEVTCPNAASLDSSHYNTVKWAPVKGADSFKVYCRTPGAELLCANVPQIGGGTPWYTGSYYTWKDDGSVTPSGAMPTVDTTGFLVAPVVNATNGFKVNGAGTSGRFLKGDGTKFVISSGSASGTGACGTHQWASALNSDAAPTCTQPAFSDISGTLNPTTQLGTGSGAVTLAAGGTNQNVTLTPSGSGGVTANGPLTVTTTSGTPLTVTGGDAGSGWTIFNLMAQGTEIASVLHAGNATDSSNFWDLWGGSDYAEFDGYTDVSIVAGVGGGSGHSIGFNPGTGGTVNISGNTVWDSGGGLTRYAGDSLVGRGQPTFAGQSSQVGFHATVGSTNILATTWGGTGQVYRVGYTMWQATAGSGGTCNNNATATVTLAWTDPANQSQTKAESAMNVPPTLAAGAYQQDEIVVPAKASSALSYSIAWSNGNCTTQPTVTIKLWAEELN